MEYPIKILRITTGRIAEQTAASITPGGLSIILQGEPGRHPSTAASVKIEKVVSRGKKNWDTALL